MKQQRTVPHQALPRTQSSNRAQQRPLRKRQKKSQRRMILFVVIPVMTVIALLLFAIMGMVALRLTFANTILPGVRVGDIALGGHTPQEAAAILQREWGTITLSDGERHWMINADSIGIGLDVERTVEQAFAQGHGEGGMTALIREVQIAPVLDFDPITVMQELTRSAATFEIPPVNAGFEFVNDQLQVTAAQSGKRLDAGATVAALDSQPETVFQDGVLTLRFTDAAPMVSDATPLLGQARAIVDEQPSLRIYDPVTDDSAFWQPSRETWAGWLRADMVSIGGGSLILQTNETTVRDYLTQMVSSAFDASRTLDVDDAVARINGVLAQGIPDTIILQVQHQPRTHIVQAGETLTSIGWDYGFPYLYLVEANGGIQSVSIGQEITIPPADFFLSEFPVDPNKRIVVDLSDQRTRVYQNGQLIHDWLTSTGVNDSPTWTGIYQILSHEPNAYAANWNLYMPNFMGVYRPVPDVDFTNGFHGYPTRGGGQILWRNNLGTRVTYGCIMLSDENMRVLYEWAQEGVVVEIQP